MAFDLLARILGEIQMFLSASSILSLLMPMILHVLSSIVSREIVLVVTASKVSGMARN